MAESTRRSAFPHRNRDLQDPEQEEPIADGDGQEAVGRRLPMTEKPSVQNVLAGFYNALPPMVRDLLPYWSSAKILE